MARLAGYGCRVRIPINYSSDGALTNFQVRINILKGTGSNSAGNIYLQGLACNWPYDIRFTTSDGVTLLDFWRQEYDDTDGTWVLEIPSIASSGTTDIYIYWGKDGDSDASSAANTAKDGAGYVFPMTSGLDTGFWTTSVGSPFLSLGVEATPASSGTSIAVDGTKYEAWPTIVMVASGRKYIFYRTADTATHSYEATGKIAYRYSDDDFATVSDEVTVTSNSNMDERDPGALVFSNGGVESIMLTYDEYDGTNFRMYSQVAPVSTMTFAAKVAISAGNNRAAAANPIQLSNGTILLPIYWTGGNVYVAKTTNGGTSWSVITVTTGDTTYTPDESCLIELKTSGSYSGKVAIFSRCEVSPYGYRKAESTDYGETWGAYAAVSTISAPTVACPIHVLRMPNNNLAAIYTINNDIVMYTSGDEGANFVYIGILVDRGSGEDKHYTKALFSGSYVHLAWCTNSTNSNVYYNKVRLYPFLRFYKLPADPVYLQGPTVSRPAILECRIMYLDEEGTYKYNTPFGFGKYLADYSDDMAGIQIYSTGGKYCAMAIASATRSLSGTGVTKDNNWSIWKLVWAANLVQYFDDGVQKDSNITTNVPSSNRPLTIGRPYYVNAGCRCLIEWMFVRKYTAHEPTWATPASMERYTFAMVVIG